MHDDDWKRLDTMLDELLAREPAERAARLDEIAATEPATAARLGRLLGGIARSEGIEQLGASEVVRDALAALEGLGTGDRLGAWTLRGRVGEGGMAEVFEASRPVGDGEQRAAIKVMAMGLGGESQRRRFRQETAILARLEDPRLSRLIDAGTAPDGRPWLAMEFVEGRPIDAACDTRALGLTGRVRLMVQVARALDRCHRSLVVHRDLKPSNVFVTAAGQVRVLDFGIAKVNNPDGSDPGLTATRARAFTLRYASPEQLAGRVAGVETDVYQLGLMLYLLLSGRRAFADVDNDPVALQKAMMRGPALPSQACLGAGEVAARARGAARPERLARQLRGDLDAVVMRALEASPADRYPGARDLADDLEAWLDGRPVQARTQTAWYRTARYLRQHWIGAGALAAIFLLVAGYAVTATWQGQRLAAERNAAETARLRAEAIQGFLLDVFGSVDPESKASRGKSIETLLVEGAERARTEFADRPLLAAQLLLDMGGVLARRGRLPEAIAALESAHELRSETLGPTHPDTLAVVIPLGEALYEGGEGPRALALLSAHLERTEDEYGAESDAVVDALMALAPPESVYGDIVAAEAQLERAMALLRRLHPGLEETPSHPALPRLAQAEHLVATVLLRGQRYADALVYEGSSLARYEALFGRLDARTLEARKNYGFALRMVGRRDEATAVLAETLADERRLYDGPHWQIAYTLGHMANVASDQHEYALAESLWQEAEEETREAMGEDYWWIDSTRIARARAMLLGDGDRDVALAMLREVAGLEDRGHGLPERARSYLERFGGE